MTTGARYIKMKSLLLALLLPSLASAQAALQLGNGTSQGMFNNWPAHQYEITEGTSSSPVTTNGPTFKISRVENYGSSPCSGNPVDTECNAALLAEVTGLSTDFAQVTAVAGYATSTSTNGASNAVIGGVFVGEVLGSGNGTGQGAYLEGRRNTSTGNVQGIELRVDNNTATDCTVSYSGFSPCDDLWATYQGDGIHTTAGSSAIHIFKTSSSFNNGWHEGITFNNGSIVDYAFNDQSTGTTSVNIGSGHVNAIVAPNFTLTGAGVITSPVTIQNGAASGGEILGADVNATTRTVNVRKLGKIVAPTYDNTSAPVAVISADDDSGLVKLQIGGSLGSSSVTAATEVDILAAATPNTLGGTVIARVTTTGLQIPNTTVSALPTCGASQKGYWNAVSDATAPTYNAALTGGGTISVPVYCNGTSWTSH